MKTPKLYVVSLFSTAAVIVYILFIAWLMPNLGQWLPPDSMSFIGPAIFLLTFVLSATIVATLVLGFPIWLYFENKKKDALKLFAYNVGFLFAALILAIAVVVVWFPKITMD